MAMAYIIIENEEKKDSAKRIVSLNAHYLHLILNLFHITRLNGWAFGTGVEYGS
jgi:hypothetical protein